jgi:TonB family protein
VSLLILHPNKLRPGVWYQRDERRLVSVPDWLAALLISVGLHAVALPWLPAPESRIEPVLEQVRQSLVVMLGAETAQDAAAALEMPTVSLDAIPTEPALEAIAPNEVVLADTAAAVELPMQASTPVSVLALDASVSEQAQFASADVAYSEVALSSLVIETGLEAQETVVARDLQATDAVTQTVKNSAKADSGASSMIGRYGSVPGIDAAYQKRLASHIQGFVAYVKKIAEDRKMEGQAMVRYEIDRTGALLQAEITRSTGYAELDAAILKMLEFASPMIPLPDEHPTGRQFFGQTISVWLKSAALSQ